MTHPPDPIDTLVQEHALIERVLAAFASYCAELDRDAAPASDLTRFVRFFEGFVDGLHHAKEEDILFRALQDAGFPLGHGPLAVMLHEHELGRTHVRALAAIAATPDWSRDPAVRTQVVTHGRGFASHLRAHIHKENHVLYPMARQCLGAAMADVAAACAAFDADDEHRRLREALVKDLDL